MGDTLSLKITDKAWYIQHLDRSRYDSTDLFRIMVNHSGQKISALSQRPDYLNYFITSNVVHVNDRQSAIIHQTNN